MSEERGVIVSCNPALFAAGDMEHNIKEYKDYVFDIVRDTKEEAAIAFMDEFIKHARKGSCFMMFPPIYEEIDDYINNKKLHTYKMRILIQVNYQEPNFTLTGYPMGKI